MAMELVCVFAGCWVAVRVGGECPCIIPTTVFLQGRDFSTTQAREAWMWEQGGWGGYMRVVEVVCELRATSSVVVVVGDEDEEEGEGDGHWGGRRAFIGGRCRYGRAPI